MKRTIILLSVVFFTSCMTTKTPVGHYKTIEGNEYKYDKGKQYWLLWGTMPVGRKKVDTPLSGDCEIQTSFTLFDAILSGITLGIVSSQTITVKAKK